ncbi:MAG: hypothetical protein ACI83Y_000387 [Candidatus Azotimanducaceae bacterium]|jgi:hypothetical protein
MYITKHSNLTDRTVLDSFWPLYEVSCRPIAASDHQASEALFHLERQGLAQEHDERARVYVPESNQADERGGAAESIMRPTRLCGPVHLESFGVTRDHAPDFAPETVLAATVGGRVSR